jgi:hypothetical protein
VVFEVIESLDLPAYLGSTLRGAFGHAFRAVACPAPRECDCPIPTQCPYHLIFETAPPPDAKALRTHDEIPRPFVISPSTTPSDQQYRQTFRPGDEVIFELVLIGRAQEFFPYFVVALREVERIGRSRRSVELRRIDALARDTSPNLIYDVTENLVRGSAPASSLDDLDAPPPQDRLDIEFLTQTRLKHDGRFVRRPDFHILFRRLLGRLSSLARFHCGAPLDTDYRGLIDTAATIQLVSNSTRWVRWARYSSRQDRRMEWEGITGRATYRGDFGPFWPYLQFGQLTHVGHGCTFGLGKYRLSA